MPPSAQQLLPIAIEDENSGPEKVVYRFRSRNDATFKSGLEEPVHRWFRLTPSFGAELVRQLLEEMQVGKDELVLDPFAGASTTLIECKRLGFECTGFEINPFLHFVGEASLNWSPPSSAVLESLESVEKAFSQLRRGLSYDGLLRAGYSLPPIHNSHRWWRDDVLVDLLVLKRAIKETVASLDLQRLFLLGFAGSLVPDLTNVTLGRLQLHFIDRKEDSIDVLSTVSEKMRQIACDLDTIKARPTSEFGSLQLRDATRLQDYSPPKKIGAVITSPPYPNRYSYVWNTRPHLYFFDFFSEPSQASELDTKTIGGTWGTATSSLMKGRVEPGNEVVSRIIGPVAETIRKSDNLMANYLMKYFNLLGAQIAALIPHLAPDARISYVVGCSRLKGVFVEVDVLLGELFEGLSPRFRVDRIERFRKRNSGKDLHESIVHVISR